MTKHRHNDIFLPAFDQPSGIRAAATILGSPNPGDTRVQGAIKILFDEAYRRTPGVRTSDIKVSVIALTKAIYSSQSNTSNTTPDEAFKLARERMSAFCTTEVSPRKSPKNGSTPPMVSPTVNSSTPDTNTTVVISSKYEPKKGSIWDFLK